MLILTSAIQFEIYKNSNQIVFDPQKGIEYLVTLFL